MLGWRGALLCVFQLSTFTPGNADKGCSGFGHLENGRTFFRYGGLYVTFTCNPGFRIHGYHTSSCVSGQWARNPPLCVASGCPGPGDLLHGRTVISKDRSLAFFSCDAGFRLFGSALLYCKGKNWNGTKPACKLADIMSDLHLNQEPSHGPVSAQGSDVPTSLKVHLHSHLNTLAITAPKDAFLKSELLEVPHMKFDFTDEQKNIRKPVEKKLSKSLLFDKARDRAPEPIKNPENFKDPIRSSDLQKPVPVMSTNVNTTSLTNYFYESSLSTTTPTSFVARVMDTQVKIMDQTVTEAPYRGNIKVNRSTLSTDRDQGFTVTSAAKILPEYIKNISHWTSTTPKSAPNSNTFSTNDHLQSETFVTEDTSNFASSTANDPGLMESNHGFVSSTAYSESTAITTCRGLCEQSPDFLETSPPPNPTRHTSSSIEVLTTATGMVSGLPLNSPADVLHFTDVIDDRQVNEKSSQNDPKQELDPTTWKDLPRFPTRKRPVCPYPPFPSHGTFYFRSIKNPSPLQYKHYIQYACYPGYTLTNGDVYSYCQHNGQWSGQTPLCLELTPCSRNNGGCSQICHVSEQNRAQCLCEPGFLLLEDQRTCRDLDECVEELHQCQQVCENTLGSYRCSCRPGFQLSPDGTSCSDIDECEHLGRALCVLGCINTPGSFQCSCPEGFQLDSTSRHCVDINECEEMDDMDQKLLHRCEWKCVDLPGTYRCICPRGYRLRSDGHQCEDIDECELWNGGCTHLCINHRGSYKCACPEKYRLFPYNRKDCQPVGTHT